jgi:hypothetical protein
MNLSSVKGISDSSIKSFLPNEVLSLAVKSLLEERLGSLFQQ